MYAVDWGKIFMRGSCWLTVDLGQYPVQKQNLYKLMKKLTSCSKKWKYLFSENEYIFCMLLELVEIWQMVIV